MGMCCVLIRLGPLAFVNLLSGVSMVQFDRSHTPPKRWKVFNPVVIKDTVDIGTFIALAAQVRQLGRRVESVEDFQMGKSKSEPCMLFPLSRLVDFFCIATSIAFFRL